MGAAAASATLADKTYLALSLEATKLSKKIVTDALDELGIEYLPSQANFIFHKTKKGVDYKAKMAEATSWWAAPSRPTTTGTASRSGRRAK